MHIARLLTVSPSMHCARGVPGPGGHGIPACTEADPARLWTDRHLWKHNLRKLRLRAVKIAYLPQIPQLFIRCLPSLPQNLEILCGRDTWLYQIPFLLPYGLHQPPPPNTTTTNLNFSWRTLRSLWLWTRRLPSRSFCLQDHIQWYYNWHQIFWHL